MLVVRFCMKLTVGDDVVVGPMVLMLGAWDVWAVIAGRSEFTSTRSFEASSDRRMTLFCSREKENHTTSTTPIRLIVTMKYSQIHQDTM